MEKKEYLTEENYQKSNQKVKKIGKTMMIIGAALLIFGIVLCVMGFIGFGSVADSAATLGSESVKPSGIFSSMGMIGIGAGISSTGSLLLFIGFVIRFLIGNRREITAYTTQQVMPVAQEGIDKMAPTIGNAVSEIAKGIKQGINEADKEK